MFKKANPFDAINEKSRRLKLAKRMNDKFNVMSAQKQAKREKYVSHKTSFGGKKQNIVKTGNSTVVVKTNYQVAGKLYNNKRATRKEVGSHASASLQYMNNHGAEDIKDQELSNIYDETGERLTQEELKDLMKSLREDEEYQAMRRSVISIDKEGLTREELSQIVRDSMFEFQEQTGSSFDFKYAIHTDTEQIHAHVLATGDARNINMNKEQLLDLKVAIAEKTEEVIRERELGLDKTIDRMIDKVLEETKDKTLTLNQQVDKELDGKLDDKFREEDLEKAIKEAYEKDHTNDRSLGL